MLLGNSHPAQGEIRQLSFAPGLSQFIHDVTEHPVTNYVSSICDFSLCVAFNLSFLWCFFGRYNGFFYGTYSNANTIFIKFVHEILYLNQLWTPVYILSLWIQSSILKSKSLNFIRKTKSFSLQWNHSPVYPNDIT